MMRPRLPWLPSIAFLIGVAGLPAAHAATNWWNGGGGEGHPSLNTSANWKSAPDGTGDPTPFGTAFDGVVTVNNFGADLPDTLSAALTLNSLSFNAFYAGAVAIAASAATDLTLSGLSLLRNGNADRVTFNTNITVKLSNAGAATVDGGAGGITIAKSIDRMGDARVTSFNGAVTLGAFSGNRGNLRLRGSGTLTLSGGNSDFNNNLYIEDALTVVVNGTGTNMFDNRPLYMAGTATLDLRANNPLADGSDMYFDGQSRLLLNGRTETVKGISSFNTVSTSVVDLAGGHLTIAAGEDTTRRYAGALRDSAGTGQLTKRGTGTQSFGASGGVNAFAGTLNWTTNSGRIDLNGAKALSTPITIEPLNTLGFNALDALDGDAITIARRGRLSIGGTATQVNSTVSSAPFSLITGNPGALSPAQLVALARKTCVEQPPFLAVPGMPTNRLIAALQGTLTFSGSDLSVDPAGVNGPGYMGIGAGIGDLSVSAGAGDPAVIRYWNLMTLAALPARILTIQAPVASGAAGPLTADGGGQVILNASNAFQGAVQVAANTRLEINCDPNNDRIPELSALGAANNPVRLASGATLAYRRVANGVTNLPGTVDMGARTVSFDTVSDPTLEVGGALEVRLAAGGLSSTGGGLTKTGTGRLTLLGDNPGFNATETSRVGAGVLVLGSTNALNGRMARVSTTNVYAVTFNAVQADLAKVTTDSTGIFGVNGTISGSLDLSSFAADSTGPGGVTDGVPDTATLFIGSSATGTIQGTVTGAALDTNADGVPDRGVIRLGGGGGVLTIEGGLADVNPGGGALPTDLVGSGSGGSRGVVILKGANSFSGNVIPNQTLFVFHEPGSVPGTGDIEVGAGSAPKVAGNVRMAPFTMEVSRDATGYSRDVLLDGGQVAWHDRATASPTKTLTALSQVGQYYAGTGAPPASVVLGLGAPQANANLALQFPVTDWDHDGNAGTPAIPVQLTKAGSKTLDLTHVSQQANSYSGATDIVSGKVVVNHAANLGRSGRLKTGAGSALQTPVGLAFNRFEPLGNYTTFGMVLAADAEANGTSFVLAGTGVTVTVAGALSPAVATSPSIVVQGGGKLVLAPTNNLYDQGFGLFVRQGSTVEFNQMPERRTVLGAVDCNGCGSLIVEDGATARFVAGGVGANDGAFRELNVRGKAELYVDSGLSLDIVAQQATRMLTGAWMVKTGPGTLRLGSNPIANIGGDIGAGGGTYDIRGGDFYLQINNGGAYQKGGKSGHKSFASGTSFFIQHGATALNAGSGEGVFWRDFAVNNQDQVGVATLTSQAWEAGNNAAPLISGDTIWGKAGGIQGATLRVLVGMRFNRVAPSVTRVNVANALVQIVGGAVVQAYGTVDPFYDLSGGRAVSVTNGSSATIASGGGFRIRGGAKRIGTLSGAGASSVTNGSLRVAQWTGTGTVAVRPSGTLAVEGFAPGASAGRLTIQNAGMAQWMGGAAASTFEVMADGVRTGDFVKVTGRLDLDTSSARPIVIHVALAPGAPAPGGAIPDIEIVNATVITNFNSAHFELRPSAELAALKWVRKAPGPVGGESLYLSAQPPYPLAIVQAAFSNRLVVLSMEVADTPRTCHVQRAFTLQSNDWHTITSIVIHSPEFRWTGPSNRWERVFYRLRSEE